MAELLPLIVYQYNFRCMDTLSGEGTLSIFVLSPFSMGVDSERKEFAPLGANSLL